MTCFRPVIIAESLQCLLSIMAILEAHEAKALGLTLFILHDNSTDYLSMRLKELSKVIVTENLLLALLIVLLGEVLDVEVVGHLWLTLDSSLLLSLKLGHNQRLLLLVVRV